MQVGALSFFVLIACGCDALNPNRQIQTRDLSIRLIEDNSEVNQLLLLQREEDAKVELFWREKHTQEERIRRIEERRRNPDALYPRRKAFLNAIAREPARSFPSGSYLRLLNDSKVRCSQPLSTENFVKVRVTSGALEGQVGWVCEDGVFRTVTPL